LKLSTYSFKNAFFFGAGLFLLHVGANYLYEPRSPFAKFILDGNLLSSLLFLVLLGAFGLGIYFLFKVKLRKAFGLLIWSGIFMPIIGLALFWDLSQLDVFKEDRVVYSSALQENEKLILQYYETGITGNPNWRVIQVEDQYQSFRRYRRVDINLFVPGSGFENSIRSGEIHYDKLPKTISLGGKTYLLEQTKLFDGRTIKESAK
jgi:hypothetical protein